MEVSYVDDKFIKYSVEKHSNNDYQLNLKYLENINKHFEFIVCDIWDRKDLFLKCSRSVDYDNYIKRFNILCELIKDFFKNIENGELKDISNFIFPIEYVFNISEVKKSFNYYKGFTRCCHGIFLKKENDKKIVDSYEKNFKYLELLLSKIRIEDDFGNLDSLLPKERLYLKDEFVLKVCNNVIRLDPISSEYPTFEEYHKTKNNLNN